MIPLTAPLFDDDEVDGVRRCLESGWVTQGPVTSEFERIFALRHNVTHALATTSCTAALHLAVMALGLKPGDEVIVPSFTWVTSAHAAEYVGARAVFADIDLNTFNLDPSHAEAAITPRTRAIVAVHLFGRAAPMDEILDLAARRRLAVIEDAACAVGTTYKGVPVGALGDVACFSFHPRKVITTGEGGMVTTNRDDLVPRLKALRNHGATGLAFGVDPRRPSSMSTFDEIGYNLRLSDIQAAVGVAQMKKLEKLLEERRRLACRYTELLAGMEEVIPPQDDPGHTYQSYVVRLRRPSREFRDAIMDGLAAAGIQTRPGTHSVPRLGYYARKYGLNPTEFPNAALGEDTTITLPIFPGMTESDQFRVIESIRAGIREAAAKMTLR